MGRFFSIDRFMQELARVQVLQDMYEETHDESVLEAAIDIWQRILPQPFLKQTPQDTQAFIHAQAGQSFFYRYENKGRLEDLEMAIHLFSKALQHVTDASLHATILHSLGDVLTRRYEHIGKLEDLEKSIAYYRDAIVYIDSDDTNWSAYMDDLGTALRDHYTHTWDLLSLDESIKTHRQMLKVAIVSSSHLSPYFNHLGGIGPEKCTPQTWKLTHP